MTDKVSDLDWEDIFRKFSLHKGTLTSFCRENNITTNQFYSKKRKLKKQNNATFHAINFKSEKPKELECKESSSTTNIRIQIGKANIYIPSNYSTSLSYIMKEIIEIC